MSIECDICNALKTNYDRKITCKCIDKNICDDCYCDISKNDFVCPFCRNVEPVDIINIKNIKRKNKNYSICTVIKSYLINCTIKNSDVYNSLLLNCNVKNCNFINCKFVNCKINLCICEKSKFKTCHVISSNIYNSKSESTGFYFSEIYESKNKDLISCECKLIKITAVKSLILNSIVRESFIIDSTQSNNY